MRFEAEERDKEMKKLHEQVRAHIEKVTEQYKAKANNNRTHLELQLGDFVWLYLRKERSPLRRKSKLMTRRCGLYKIVQRVGDNAYEIELPDDINIFSTFTVGDLTPYIEDDDEGHEYLRANPLQRGAG